MNAVLILALAAMVCLYKGAFCQSIRSDFVLLNQPYTFPVNASGCHYAEWRKRPPTDVTIATYNNHACTTGKGFEEELRCRDSHLLLKSAKYSDKGSYEFICNGVETLIHLDVLYYLNVSAEETDNITLNCYAHNAKDVTWLHNTERVLHYKMDGSVNFSKGYERRASLEKNCFKTGDFSLTIARVFKTDFGIYRCFVDDETVTGNPHASVLHVNEKSSGPDQTHSSCNEATLIVLTVVSGLISVICVIYAITTKRRRRQSTSPTASQSSENDPIDTDPILMSANRLTTPVSESQAVDTYPVPESNSMENKPSNTRPIL